MVYVWQRSRDFETDCRSGCGGIVVEEIVSVVVGSRGVVVEWIWDWNGGWVGLDWTGQIGLVGLDWIQGGEEVNSRV